MNLEHKDWNMQKREQISLCLWCGISLSVGSLIASLYIFKLAIFPLILILGFLFRCEVQNNRGMGNILKAEGKIQ